MGFILFIGLRPVKPEIQLPTTRNASSWLLSCALDSWALQNQAHAAVDRAHGNCSAACAKLSSKRARGWLPYSRRHRQFGMKFAIHAQHFQVRFRIAGKSE